MASNAKIIFLHTGWTNEFKGDDHDTPVGSHAYIKEDGEGWETLNFRPYIGLCSGYAPVPGGRISIQVFGAAADVESIEGVIVVWTATRPERGRVIIGWYRNATVFRASQNRRTNDFPQQSYNVIADEKDCTLVPSVQRSRIVPVANMGNAGFPANIVASWFPTTKSEPAVAEWLVSTLAYMDRYDALAPKLPLRRQPDIEKRRAVEDAAMACVRAHYEMLGYHVDDVSSNNLGWDQEAIKGSDHLRLEVKGLSGPSMHVEITHNEYSQVVKSYGDYRICVVVNALSEPKLHVFDRVDGRWLSGDLVMSFEELVSARGHARRVEN